MSDESEVKKNGISTKKAFAIIAVVLLVFWGCVFFIAHNTHAENVTPEDYMNTEHSCPNCGWRGYGNECVYHNDTMSWIEIQYNCPRCNYTLAPSTFYN